MGDAGPSTAAAAGAEAAASSSAACVACGTPALPAPLAAVSSSTPKTSRSWLPLWLSLPVAILGLQAEKHLRNRACGSAQEGARQLQDQIQIVSKCDVKAA